MAKLTALPERAIISGFKGKVDFYEYLGIPVARCWPRSPGKHRAPSVEAQWPMFAYAARIWNQLDVATQEAFNGMAIGTGLNGRDYSMRAYLSGLYSYPTGA